VLGAVAKLAVSGTREARIAAIASRQRGFVALRQLLAAGLDYHAIRRRVRNGQLIPVHPGVFSVGHLPPGDLAAETVALLAVRWGAALAWFSAASLWDLAITGDGDVHLVVPGSGGGAPEGCRLHRSRTLGPRDLRVRRGVPVTSPARALLDVAPAASERELERGFDRALVAGTMYPSDVAELLARVGKHAGVPLIRELLHRARGTTVTRSDAEELFLALIRNAGLPEPEVNVMVAGFEVDFLWRSQRLVVEVDSFGFHSTQRRFEGDHRKEAVVRAAGFEVLRFTYWQIESEPLVVVAGVARRV
jgi:very-short-patch-repair endonuclease